MNKDRIEFTGDNLFQVIEFIEKYKTINQDELFMNRWNNGCDCIGLLCKRVTDLGNGEYLEGWSLTFGWHKGESISFPFQAAPKLENQRIFNGKNIKEVIMSMEGIDPDYLSMRIKQPSNRLPVGFDKFWKEMYSFRFLLSHYEKDLSKEDKKHASREITMCKGDMVKIDKEQDRLYFE